MSRVIRAFRTLLAYGMILMLSWGIVPPGAWGADTTGQFTLTIHEHLLSLKATDASVQEILEEIGRRMHIEVVMRLTTAEQVTLEFNQLPILEAIKQFSPYIS